MDNRERLYTDLVYRQSRYVTWNVDLLPAINQKHRLSLLDTLILADIAMTYDSNNQNPCKYSYQDLVNKYGHTRNAVIATIDVLLKKGLIECLNKEKRVGRSKFQYVPHVTVLRGILIEYMDKKKP